MKSQNETPGTGKKPNIILTVGAEIILFTIYLTMRIVYAPAFWAPFPRYSDWKVCTRPDYQTKHVKEFVALAVQALIVFGLSFFMGIWIAIVVGVAITNLIIGAWWLIRKL